jgi:hypothetical protein
MVALWAWYQLFTGHWASPQIGRSDDFQQRVWTITTRVKERGWIASSGTLVSVLADKFNGFRFRQMVWLVNPIASVAARPGVTRVSWDGGLDCRDDPAKATLASHYHAAGGNAN